MKRRNPFVFVFVVLGLVAISASSGCKTTLKPLPQNPPRIIDSPPEQRAALNEAANLGIPQEERRFGIEQEKELKRQEAEKAQDRKDKTAVIPMPVANRAGAMPDAGAIPDGGNDGKL
ncbi:MAG TPA: hypothetical protein VHK47_10925 [Polyangia bacterium]|nr:hypothetical protein [Polyangia bacterium]